jgi:hypothetical protein
MNDILSLSDYLDPYLPMMKNSDHAKAFRSVLKITPSHPTNPEFKYVFTFIHSSGR